MKVKESYIKGWKLAIKTIQNAYLLYAANFLLALIIGVSFATSISSDSLLFNKLFKQFNFTIFAEFLQNYKALISMLKSQFVLFSAIYLLITIFLTGGIIDSFYKGKFESSQFWTNSSKFFFRYLRQAIYILIINALLLVLLLVSISAIFSNLIEKESTENAFILFSILLFIIYLLLNSFVYIISDYAKFGIYFTETDKVLSAIWRSTKYVFKNFGKVYLLFIFLMASPFVLISANLLVSIKLEAINYLSLILIFLIGQMFIFARIFARTWVLSGQYSLFTLDFNKKIENKRAEFMALDEKAEQISKTQFEQEKSEIRQNKEEKAQTVIQEVNEMLKNIQKQLEEIEKEARPEIKEQLIEKLIQSSESEEWEILEEKAEESNKQKELSKVMSLVDEIKLEKIAKKTKIEKKVQKTSDDLFDFDE